MAEASFRINGVQMELGAARVRDVMRDSFPETVNTHVVEVDGIIFPVKQVFGEVTGLDRLDFTTNQARTVLKRLGFQVSRA